MTIDEARVVISTVFATSWGSTTVLILPNEKYTPIPGTPWTRLTYQELYGGQQTLGPIGSRKYERRSLIFLEFYGLLDVGSKATSDYVHTARGILEGRDFSGVSVFNLFVQDEGEDDRWYRVVLQGLLTYNETK